MRLADQVCDAIGWISSAYDAVPSSAPVLIPSAKNQKALDDLAREEVAHRNTISTIVETLLEAGDVPTPCQALHQLSPIQRWLLQQRLTTGVVLLGRIASHDVESDLSTPDLLHLILVDKWNSHGCILFWEATAEYSENDPTGGQRER